MIHLTHLTYRLKGADEVVKVSFESQEEAVDYLISHDLQRIVGEMPGLDAVTQSVLKEAAAKGSKADWFEFSHSQVELA